MEVSAKCQHNYDTKVALIETGIVPEEGDQMAATFDAVTQTPESASTFILHVPNDLRLGDLYRLAAQTAQMNACTAICDVSGRCQKTGVHVESEGMLFPGQ